MDIVAELRRLLGPDALTTAPDDLAPLLQDHRHLFQGRALALALPDSSHAVASLIAFCNRHRIAVVPQGGNTGYCGGATPDAQGKALLLSMRRMNRIRAVDAEDFALVAEAGCTLAQVQAAAEAAGRYFPLSLGSEGTCQIGGNLATNAGGTAVLRYGMMRELTLGIEAVLADGSLFSQLSPLRKDNTGYDLKGLLIGSEGTLGIITAACLKLYPAVRTHATAWIALASATDALSVLALLRERSADRLVTCELVPQAALELVLRHIPAARDPGVAPAPWYLLVELASSGDDELDALLEGALGAALQQRLIQDAAVARNGAQREDFWRLRESVPAAQRAAGASLKHDVSVPVARIPAFIERGAALVERQIPEGFLVAYGHIGDGNLHFNVNQRAGADPAAFAAREAPLKRAVHDLVASMGGSFSAEHGIGQLKVAELERYAQPAELAAMRAIKQALDPNGILNPGKVLRSTSS
ncbi:MAG: FAD-binding oxidoreductase [Steroidobacteraceae bacterium]